MVEERRTFEPAESREDAERLFIEDFDTWDMTGYYLYSKLLRSGVSRHIGTGGTCGASARVATYQAMRLFVGRASTLKAKGYVVCAEPSDTRTPPFGIRIMLSLNRSLVSRVRVIRMQRSQGAMNFLPLFFGSIGVEGLPMSRRVGRAESPEGDPAMRRQPAQQKRRVRPMIRATSG